MTTEFRVGDKGTLRTGSTTYSARVIYTELKGDYPVVVAYEMGDQERTAHVSQNGKWGVTWTFEKERTKKYINVYKEELGSSDFFTLDWCDEDNRRKFEKRSGLLEATFDDEGNIVDIAFIRTDG